MLAEPLRAELATGKMLDPCSHLVLARGGHWLSAEGGEVHYGMEIDKSGPLRVAREFEILR
ncbi:MAG TPA: hypothetical protein VHW01_08260 [Polyangiaceae bacterium]|nr:hypothetical protein [Polyangiaceae bacterium]